SSFTASSKSPLVSTSARLHSIIPALVASRSCLTIAAVMSVIRSSPSPLPAPPRRAPLLRALLLRALLLRALVLRCLLLRGRLLRALLLQVRWGGLRPRRPGALEGRPLRSGAPPS